MSPNIPDVRYLACWTEDDGIYSCEHESVAGAMKCLVPDGRSFIRACESGAFRSLNETEFAFFLVALSTRNCAALIGVVTGPSTACVWLSTCQRLRRGPLSDIRFGTMRSSNRSRTIW